MIEKRRKENKEMAQAQQNQAVQAKTDQTELEKLTKVMAKILVGQDELKEELQEQIDEIKKSLWGETQENQTSGKIPELEKKVEEVFALPKEIELAKKNLSEKITQETSKIPGQVDTKIASKTKAIDEKIAKIEKHLREIPKYNS